jgi:hypothetical protein
MTFNPASSLYISSRGLTFHIMARYPISPPIIMTRHPDPLPFSWNPFFCGFPVPGNIFGLWLVIVWFWLRWRWWIVSYRRWSIGMDLMGNDPSQC